MSKGMIRNAVIQSGGGISETASAGSDNGQRQAEQTGKTFMDKFGYTSLKKMRNASAEKLNCGICSTHWIAVGAQ